jgi:hypothetical protein
MAQISTITDFVVYDNILIERTVDYIPSGQTIAQAWFTIKHKFSDSDVDAIIALSITTTPAAQGVITSNILDFYLTDADTGLLTPLAEYKYSIKLKLSNNQLYTPEMGIIVGLPAVKKGST